MRWPIGNTGRKGEKMIIKETSVKTGDSFIRDTNKEISGTKCFKVTQTKYDKAVMEYYKRNKAAGLLEYEVIEQ